ncbi:MAG: DNA repair protein RecO [Pseudomonadota bacterium]
MEWRDEGILLWVRRHGEKNAVIEALSAEHGRHAGLVRGGASNSVSALLQPGAQLSLEWNARLAEHLGNYKVDLIRSRAATIMTDRVSLACLNVVSALLVQFLPEREPNKQMYSSTLDVVDALAQQDRFWPYRYAQWELKLLEILGFGLDLSRCASTGATEDLTFVSPRSGRAVCRTAGAPFADRMLPLPSFLLGARKPQIGDVREALRMTGYFLKHWVCDAYDIQDLPESRTRLVRLLANAPPGLPDAGDGDLTESELTWLGRARTGN